MECNGRQTSVPAAPDGATPRRRRRVLIEDADPAWCRTMQHALLQHGYEVIFCGGPEQEAGGCRLVEERTCPLVESADVVLNSLDLGAPENRAVLAALHTLAPQTPVLALVSHRDGWAHPSCLYGSAVEYFPTSVQHLLGRLEELVSP